ncbi:hypothetical protein [Hydrogenophaga sp. BPS33]|uniref:hypothetical protein n=1 Tax=Hydrogenophaga sp. BPS33 TaxID=2651974 RepID=UPI0013201F5C|nr:hypothetical protein [Hydrogenophaga sp. BPS33]QHE84255.1 hypothetical protein F9K07_04805 [Hydrogenophaga sp. BPS33]
MNPAASTHPSVFFKGGRLLDPRKDVLGGPTDILVQEGRIRALDPQGELPGNVTLVDVTGLTVMPGLIDAHVHIYMNEANIAASDPFYVVLE